MRTKKSLTQNEQKLSSLEHVGPLIYFAPNIEETVGHSATKGISSENEGAYQEDVCIPFFEKNQAVILLVNAENSDIVDANGEACKYYGWTLDELTSKKMGQIDVLPAEKMRAEMQKASAEKRKYLFSKHRLANGEIRDVEIHGSLLTFNSHKFISYTIQDITERKKADENLQINGIHLLTAQRIGNLGVWEIDLTSGRIYVSEEVRKIYGLENESCTIEKLNDILLPGYSILLEKTLCDLVEKSFPYDIQFRIRKKDGSIRVIHCVAEYYAEKNAVVGLTRDITESKKLEEASEEEVRWRRILMEQSRDGIVILDNNGSVFEANPRFAEMLGYTLEEILKLHVWDWDANYTREQLKEITRLNDNKGVFIETLHRRKDGAFLNVEINTNAALFGDRKLNFCVCRDVTERKKAEEVLLDAKLAAEAASKSKDEFLATMSHELRTPLNSIIGFSDVLLTEMFGSLNEKQRKYLNHVLISGRHLLELINNILDLSKVEAGKMELDYNKFDVSEAIAEVKTTIEPLAEKKNIFLDVKVVPQLEMIWADKSKFKQILYNLTSNAIKFTPKKGNVTIEIWRFGNMVQVSVKDNGIGISKKDMGKLFQPFNQLNPYLTRENGGTGLGLVLVKKFIEMHGGRIKVESALGEGSIFTFFIPFYPNGMNLNDFST